MTEMAIQQLLSEAGAEGLDQDLVMVEPVGLEVSADWRTLRSGETYLGYRQATGFAQQDVARFDEPARLRRARSAGAQQLGADRELDGGRPGGGADEPGGRIAFQFQARDVNLVMGPAAKRGIDPVPRLPRRPGRRRLRTGPTSPPTAAARSTTSARTS